MPINPVTLPSAGAIDYGGGNIDYYKEIDPVAAGADQMGPDNRPLRNLAYRDQLLADKLNAIIAQFGADLLSSYFVHPTAPLPTMSVVVDAGRSVRTDGLGAVVVPAPVTTAAFPGVSTIGNARFDLLCVNDSGTIIVIPGPGEVPEASDPFDNCEVFPENMLVIAIVRVAGRPSPSITQADITDMREFLNKGGGGSLTPRVAGWIINHADANAPFPIFNDPTDGYVLKYIGMSSRVEWRPDATGGGTIVVKDGATTVNNVSVVNFTSGAVVTDGGGGQANVAVSGGGGGGPIAFLPDKVVDFYFDDTDEQAATNVELWRMQPAVRFNSDSDRVTWFNFEKNKLLNNDKSIGFDLWFSLTTSAANNTAVKLTLDYWVLQDGVVPDFDTPTGTISEDVDVSFNAGNRPSNTELATLMVDKADFAALGTAERIVCRLTRNISGAGTTDYVGGSFDLISLVPKLVP